MKEWVVKTQSVEETIELATRFGQRLRSGDCVTLDGDLGAGKTHFTKGIAHALNIEQVVSSPTFTVIKEYEGTLPLYHMDVYRVGHTADDLGLDEYIEGEGVTVIEWGHLIHDLLPNERFSCTIERLANDQRLITIKASGPVQQERLEALSHDDNSRN